MNAGALPTQRHLGRWARFARHCGAPDAEDAVQDALMATLAAGRDFEEPYVMTAIQRRAWTQVRRKRRKPTTTLDPDWQGPAPAIPVDEVLDAVAALRRLPARERRAKVAQAICGGVGASAAACGVSERAYRKLITRANHRLKGQEEA